MIQRPEDRRNIEILEIMTMLMAKDLTNGGMYSVWSHTGRAADCQNAFHQQAVEQWEAEHKSGGSGLRSLVLLVLLSLFGLTLLAHAQTAVTTTFNRSSIKSPPAASGFNYFSDPYTNTGGAANYGSQQILRNYVGADNPGFEGSLVKLNLIAVTGTSTSFTTQNFYTPGGQTAWLLANYAAGNSTISVTDSAAGTGPVGCAKTPTGVTTSGTTDGPETMTLTFPACPSAIQPGDNIVFTLPIQSPLPYCTTTGGAVVSFSTVSPYDGAQSLKIDTSASGSTASCVLPFDNGVINNIGYDRFVTLDGTYQQKIYAKGTANYGLSLTRFQPPSTTLTYCTTTVTITSSYAAGTCTATYNEKTTNPAPGGVGYNIIQTAQGVNYYDDATFMKTSGLNAANTTIFTDEYFAMLQSFAGGVRFSIGQEACVYVNCATKTTMNQPLTVTQLGYQSGSEVPISYIDQLNLAAALGVDMMMTVPVSEDPTVMGKVVEFVASTNTGTGGGADRLAAGRSAPFIGASGPVPHMQLEICDECWNLQFIGANSNTGGIANPNSDIYYSYLSLCGRMTANARADAAIDNTRMKFGCNQQTGVSAGWAYEFNLIHTKWGGAPDYGSLSKYPQNSFSSYQTPQNTTAFLRVDSYNDVAGTTGFSGSYPAVTAISTGGPSGNAHLYAEVYEYGPNAITTCSAGGSPVTCSGTNNQAATAQAVQQANAGCATALFEAAKQLDGWYYDGTPAAASFAATGFTNYFTPNSILDQLWGTAVDVGGAASQLGNGIYAPRPRLLGLQMAALANIGTLGTATNTAGTYNFAYDVNGPEQAVNNVPNLEAFGFTAADGHNAHLYLNQTANTYTNTEAGDTLNSTAITQYQLSCPNLVALNEAVQTGGGTVVPTNTTAPTAVAIATSSLGARPSTISIPAYSMTLLVDQPTTTTNPPTFSPAAGTYSSAQAVTLSTTTSGASIYYTLDGSTPTTSSTLYTGPISISATTTVNAIASLSGTSSTVATAAYTITSSGMLRQII